MSNEVSQGISIILPVYNGAEYLKESIESILNQTFKNIELIIIDDGSSDESWSIIESYASCSSVKAIRKSNSGLASTLNQGILLAKYDLIARQDQDDISLPERLSVQFNFLQKHPDVAMVGTWAQIIEITKLSTRFIKHPLSSKDIATSLIFDSAFVHPSVMFRKDAIISVGMYSEDKQLQPPEDYELWTRLALKYNLRNINRVLLHYREVPTSMSRKIKFNENTIKANLNYTSSLIKKRSDPEDLFYTYHSLGKSLSFLTFIRGLYLYYRIWKSINSSMFNPFSKIVFRHLRVITQRYVHILRLRNNASK